MSKFTELVKYQKSQGKGRIGSLSSALGQKTLEKLDPRNYLFDRTGIATTLFPSLKGYQAKTETGKKLTDPKIAESTQFNAAISDTLIRIDANSKITAKNSLVLPMMARDMNLMRLNIQKLVRVSGETPSRKADMFFKRASERELMYETQFKKAGGTSDITSPTKVESKEKTNKSWLSSLFDSMFGIIGKGILIGALTFGLKTLFENEEVRNTVKDFFNTYFDKILNWTKEFVQENWEYLLAGLALAFPLTTLKLIGSGLSSLASVFSLLPGLAKMIGVAAAAVVGYKVGEKINEQTGLSKKITDLLMSGKDDEVRRMLDPDASKTTLEKFSEKSGDLTSAATGAAVSAGIAGAAGATAASVLSKTPTAFTDTAEAARAARTGKGMGVNSKEYEKIAEIFKKVAKKTPGFMTEFWRKIGHRLGFFVATKLAAVFAGVVAAPITAGGSLLISVLAGIVLVYDIVQIVKILDEIFNDLEKEQKQIEIEITSPELMTSEIPTATGEFDAGVNQSSAPQKIKVTTISKADDDREMKKLKAQQKSALERTTSSASSTTTSSPTPASQTPSGVSESLVNFIKSKEGFTPNAKWDYQQYSIGYGTKANSPDEVIDEAEADRRLRAKLEEFQKIVIDYGKQKGYDWNQGQIDGLTSFVYNLGPGALNQVTAGGTRSNEEIAKKITEYNRAGGNVVDGLTTRRKQELAMFEGGGYPATEQTPSEQQRMLALNKPDEKKSTSLASMNLQDIFSGDTSSMTKNLSNLLSQSGFPVFKKLGSDLTKLSVELENEKNVGTTTNIIDNSQTTNNSGGQQAPQVAMASGVADTDFAELLFKRSAEGAVAV